MEKALILGKNVRETSRDPHFDSDFMKRHLNKIIIIDYSYF